MKRPKKKTLAEKIKLTKAQDLGDGRFMSPMKRKPTS